MGQQQLILIVLGVIVVGVAIAGGISIFAMQAGARNKDIIINDMQALGQDVAAYSARAPFFGGGGGSIANYTIAPTGPWGTGNPDAVYSVMRKTSTAITFYASSKLVSGGFVICTFDKNGKLTSGPLSNGFAH